MNKNNHFVITINRELGSGGRTVGRKLAELLGVKYYDKAIVQGLTEKYGLTAEQICNSISDVFENHTLMKRYASQKIIAAIKSYIGL